MYAFQAIFVLAKVRTTFLEFLIVEQLQRSKHDCQAKTVLYKTDLIDCFMNDDELTFYKVMMFKNYDFLRECYTVSV